MHADDIALDQVVAALCRPETYAETPARIEVVETHMSFVFLTARHAYKLKKPVHYEFLDFSTRALRKFYCEEELRLNRRLAQDVYLDVVSLSRTPGGRLRVGAKGNALEWLVQMRRLPQEHMLDERIRHGTLHERQIVALATRLARFYRGLPCEGMASSAQIASLQAEIDKSAAVLLEHAGTLNSRSVRALRAAQTAQLKANAGALRERVAAGRIVEGHGDLRPEHVCLLDEPVVFDCLEFNRSLRIVDPWDELGFLAMECTRLGAPRAARSLLDHYGRLTQDIAPPALVALYQSIRASLRARLCLLHTREPERTDAAKWYERANVYMGMAAHHAGITNGPARHAQALGSIAEHAALDAPPPDSAFPPQAPCAATFARASADPAD